MTLHPLNDPDPSQLLHAWVIDPETPGDAPTTEYIDPDRPLRDWTESENLVTFWHGERQYAARRDQPVLTLLPDIREGLLALVEERFPDFTEERRDWGQLGWISVWKTPLGLVHIDQAPAGGVSVTHAHTTRRYEFTQGLIQALRAFQSEAPDTTVGSSRLFTGHTLEWHVAGHDSRTLDDRDIQNLPEELQLLLQRGSTLLPVDIRRQHIPVGSGRTPVVLNRMFTVHVQLGNHHLLAQAPTLLELRPYAEIIALLGL